MLVIDLATGAAAMVNGGIFFQPSLVKRGKASDADEALVRRTADKLKLPHFSGSWSGVGRAESIRKHGLEMAARLARHAFLAEAAEAHRTTAIVFAHHADDQVELFFLRLFRGAGGEGLRIVGLRRRRRERDAETRDEEPRALSEGTTQGE